MVKKVVYWLCWYYSEINNINTRKIRMVPKPFMHWIRLKLTKLEGHALKTLNNFTNMSPAGGVTP